MRASLSRTTSLGVVVLMVGAAAACSKRSAPTAVPSASASAASAAPVASDAPDAPDAAAREPAPNPWTVTDRVLVHHGGSQLLVVRLDGGGKIFTLKEPQGRPFECLEVSPSGEHVLTQAHETLTVWELQHGAAIKSRTLPKPDGEEGPCWHAVWHPHGVALTAGRALWHLKESRIDELKEPSCAQDDACGFSPGGKLFWRRGSEGVTFEELATRAVLGRIGWGEELLIDDSERYAAVMGDAPDSDGYAATELWSLSPVRRLWRRPKFRVMSFAPGGESFAGTHGHWAHRDLEGVFRTKDGTTVAGWEPSGTACSWGHAWAPNGKRYVTLDDSHIYAVDVERRAKKRHQPLEEETCGGNLIDISPSGELFATTQRVFRIAPPQQLGRFAKECGTCEAMNEAPVRFSPDGQLLAVQLKGLETGIFQATPFQPHFLTTFPGAGTWMPGTSALLIARFTEEPQPTRELVRARDGARLVIDPTRPDEQALRDFLAGAPAMLLRLREQ